MFKVLKLVAFVKYSMNNSMTSNSQKLHQYDTSLSADLRKREQHSIEFNDFIIHLTK